MKRLVCSTLALVASVFATAQDIQSKIQFEAPFKFPLFIAGNFGEPRPNHMHAGLDFKTQGKTILIASHSSEDIEVLCDTVHEMDKGVMTAISE